MSGDNRTLADLLNAAFPDALGYFENPADSGPPLQARKLAVQVPVSCCYLTDTTGQDHCQHPPIVVKPLPWTWRARERWWDARVWLARRIAGRCWPNEEE